MANESEQALDLLLKCALCTTDLLHPQAKSLSCLHSYCNSCFEKTFSAEEEHFGHDANLSCPVCHISHDQLVEDSQAAQSIQLDAFIQKLLQARDILQSGHTCELCAEDNVGAVSAHWCNDCLKFLCEKCEVWHRRLRPHDSVINLANEESQRLENFISPSKCANHEKRFKMYCPQCKVCMCSSCLLDHSSGDKACSWAVSVENVAPNIRVDGQSIIEKMALLAESMRQQNDEMKNRISERLKQCSEQKDEIWQNTEEFIRRLRENANALVADLEAKTEKEIQTIQEMIQLKDNHFKQLEILNNNIQQLLNLADNVDILLHFPRLKSKWEILENLHLDSINCQSQVIVEYKPWYIKMFQMLNEISVGCCRLENLQKSSSQLSLGESLLMKCTEDFVSQYPPSQPRLIESERQLVDKMERMITSVFVTEDNHVLVSDFFGRDLREYDTEDQLLYSYKPEGMESPLDMCTFSSNLIGVVAGSHDLFLLQRNAEAASMILIKHLRTEKKYTSLCNCYGKILALDKFSNVDQLSPDGTVLQSVLNTPRKWSCNHRISCGPTPDTFLLLDFVAEKIHCYSLDGKLQFSYNADSGKETSDVCADDSGNIYVCSRQDLYMINPNNFQKHCLVNFGRKLCQWPRMFVKDKYLYISFFTEEKNSVKIYQIS